MPKLFNTVPTITKVIQGVEFEIARGNNHAFLDRFRRLSKANKYEIDKKTLSSEEQDRVVAKAMAGTILMGWDGWLDDEGKQYKYSVKEAELVLTEDDILRNLISEFAGDYDLFMVQEEAELIKK